MKPGDNPYTATAIIKDRENVGWTIEADYAARAALVAAGGDSLLAAVATDTKSLAAVLQCLLQRHHGTVTLDHVMALSFPQYPAVEAINRVMSFAVFGPDGPPADEPEPPAGPTQAAPAATA